MPSAASQPDEASRACHGVAPAIRALLMEVVRRYWGFDALRPLQEEAILAGLNGGDSLVVLPTGGGKSLCYQVPPLLADRTDVVVSPLISLMKDQVDGLRACGYPAVALHSGLTPGERRNGELEIARGQTKLLFVSPERILTPPFLSLLGRLNVRAFAIDEAHCISHWGHDFRPEYRQLRALKERFPQASLHAYTATATQRVREDIVVQLELRQAKVLVGVFDRPNLVYRVLQRTDAALQTAEVLKRGPDEAAIVYCISRRDTEDMAESLRSLGIQAEHYHAGMTPDERRRVQDLFAEEKLNVVVATVAFGMGIDRSNVRRVIHAAMPKSVEHYQQETGRAGRDGLEAECVLLYSGADAAKWESLIIKSAADAENPGEVIDAMFELVGHMQRFAGGYVCRHKFLSEYFGQSYPKPNCGACDVCLGEHAQAVDSQVTAQKLLSCVARLERPFGVAHVVDVVRGADTERVRQYGHHQIKTYGALSGEEAKTLRSYVHQLVDQGVLERTRDEYPVLKLNAASWEVLRGGRPVQLIDPKGTRRKATAVEADLWEGVDRGLFEQLRALRRQIAAERNVLPYHVFDDAVVREMAAVRPSTVQAFLNIRGVGQVKAAEYGEPFVGAIVAYCREHNVSLDAAVGSRPRRKLRLAKRNSSPVLKRAFELFDQRQSIEQAMQALGRARSTTCEYLAQYIAERRPECINAWVDAATNDRVIKALKDEDGDRLKPIYDRLGGEVPYDIIRLVVAHVRGPTSN